MTFEMFPVT